MPTVIVDCPEQDCTGRITVDLATKTHAPEAGVVRVDFIPDEAFAATLAEHCRRYHVPAA